ncbi:PRLHR (predicted) [Pycnogonum litorale]
MVWSQVRVLLLELMYWAANLTKEMNDMTFDVMNNKSENITQERYNQTILYDWLTSIPAIQAIFSLMYATIFVLGINGNVLVCYVVFKNKHMHTVTNYFIANLALSDILLCIFAVPLTPLYPFIGRWVFGELLCYLLPYAQGVSIYISTLTLTSIAVDRYFVIIYPFKRRMKVNTCVVIIICVWLVAGLFTSPYCINMKWFQYGDNDYCEENWTDDKIKHAFAFSTTILQFAVPFAVMAFCYLKVSVRLGERAKAKPGAKSSQKEDADRERKKRTNRMLIAMVAIFGVSWLPLNVFNLIGDLHKPSMDWEYRNFSFLLTHVIAMSSTCYNPFLYAWLNENFRKEFKMVLPCYRRSRQGNRTVYNNLTNQNNGNATYNEVLVTTNSAKERSPGVPRVNYNVAEDEVQLSTAVTLNVINDVD